MRRWLLLTAVLTILWPAAGVAQDVITYESITFGVSAVGFSATTLRPSGRPPVTWCSGVLETAQIRIRYDGTAPTAAEGQPVEIGSVITITGLDKLDNFKGIRTGGVSGVVKFHCGR